jgi:DNA-binding transcriptional LysR family regulator
MDIQDLQIFARVAALQNLSAVGLELTLTPGTISKRLQALEDELSVRLFDRTTRSIRITDEGRLFYEHAQRILTELEKARASVGTNVTSPKGRLKISLPTSLGRAAMAEALARFMQAYPDVDVYANVTDRVVNLKEEGYDVAIRTGMLTDSSLIAKRLAPDHQVLVAAPSYIAANGTPQRAADLASHSCLILGDQSTWTLKGSDGTEAVRIGGRLRSNNCEFLYESVLEGLGVLRISRLRAERDILSGTLVPVLTGYEVANESAIWAVYPSSKYVLPKLRVLLDFLGEWFRETRHGSNGPAICMVTPAHAQA